MSPIGTSNAVPLTVPSPLATPTGRLPRVDRPMPDTVLVPVAQRLGMRPDELKRELEQGTSLTAVASSRGVSRDDLVEAVKQGLGTADAAKTAGQVSADRSVRQPVDRVADAIARGDLPALPPVGPPSQAGLETSTRQGGSHPQHHGSGGSLGKVASILDMPETDVADALRNGATLDQLADRANVTFSTLLRAVSDGMLYDVRL